MPKKVRSLKTNCNCKYSIKLRNETEDNSEKRLYYKVISFEVKQNNPKYYGSKTKISDEVENWVNTNFDPKINWAKVLQKLLLKQFHQEFSVSQLSYLLHRLFHKGVQDIQYLVTQILQKKKKDLNYKIGFDEVIKYLFSLVVMTQ